ncbi:conserved membrane hypothetical protein [Desulfovibrionales bacterium]
MELHSRRKFDNTTDEQSVPPASSDKFSRPSLIRAYLAILRGHGRLAWACVLLLGISGLLEGLALLRLIPVLQGNTGALSTINSDLKQDKLLAWLQYADASELTSSLLVFVLLGLTAAMVRFMAETGRIQLRATLEEDARRRMGEALLSMDWSRFLYLRLGDIEKSLVLEGYQIALGGQSFIQAAGMALVTVVLVTTALMISTETTLLTLIFGTMWVSAYRYIDSRTRRHADRLSDMVSAIGIRAQEIFGQLKFIRSSGRTSLAGSQLIVSFREYATSHFTAQAYGQALRLVLEAGGVLCMAIILYTMIRLRGLPPTACLVFLGIFYRLAPRLFALQDAIYQARTLLSWYWSWKKRLDEALAHPVPLSKIRPLTDWQKIIFKDVSFSYPNTSMPALSNISFKLRQGECVAVVGASGSGKSTLADLLLGLFLPTAGTIHVDNTLLADLDIETWRRRIGLVLQENSIFHTTVRDNVAWGEPKADPIRVRTALALARALDFVEALPEGIESVVGEQGSRLSGGERQRLALARALYRKPWLLVLDEITNALDGHNEIEVLAALKKLKSRVAILLITHRLQTAQLADTILVLDRGRCIEQGGFAELIRQPDSTLRAISMAQGIPVPHVETRYTPLWRHITIPA